MVKLKDPLLALKADREANNVLSAAEVVLKSSLKSGLPVTEEPIKGKHPAEMKLPGVSLEDRVRADFRVFLTLVWRHLGYSTPNPIQLDLAYWLQHGPDRAIIMAHRGFAKSFITGAFALWRLYCNPDEKVMVVSGGLVRAQATSNWCLGLIMTMDILKDLRPKSNNRQSATMWDVGNCIPAQSASFTAFGIGGQLVGFRGSLIIPDDVETQQNSLTVVMREKIREAVKEFESVLTPGGQIKYLGTPHDVDSLYMYLLRLRNNDGSQVYQARIWPARFPNQEEVRKYNGMLAPYIEHEIAKQGPSCIGHSTMPMRFPDEDLAKREAAMGKTEFRLQFMLDLSGSFIDKYPLKLRDLMVMDLDHRTAPEELVWGSSQPDRDLPVMGFDGDYYHKPVLVGDHYAPYNKVIGFLDPSGRGSNESSLAIGGELHGRAFLLYLYATKQGYDPATLKKIAEACVRFKVSTLYVEGNFGDGMFLSLLRPVLNAAWAKHNEKVKSADHGGTNIEEIKSGVAQKEKRILSVLEPVCQQHRLVVNRAVITYDHASIMAMEGEESRHRYALGYQFTHLTRERDCLAEDDRVESVAGLLAMMADALGVEPEGMALRARQEREEDWMRELYEEAEEAVGRPSPGRRDTRIQAARIQQR